MTDPDRQSDLAGARGAGRREQESVGEFEVVDEDRWNELLEEISDPTYTRDDVFTRTLAWVEDQFEHFKRVGTFRR